MFFKLTRNKIKNGADCIVRWLLHCTHLSYHPGNDVVGTELMHAERGFLPLMTEKTKTSQSIKL